MAAGAIEISAKARATPGEVPTIHSLNACDVLQLVHALAEIIVSTSPDVGMVVQAVREAYQYRSTDG